MARDRGLPGDASTFALPQLRRSCAKPKAWACCEDTHIVDFLEKLECLIRKVEDRRFGWRCTNGILERMEGGLLLGTWG